MKHLNILIADDTASVGEFVSAYLRDSGHEVTYVRSGEEAVAAFRNGAFDLVLMDVVMPGIGGLEAVRQIKALPTHNWVPVIIVTGMDADDDIIGGFMAGADDYILKPVKPVALDIRIRSMMRIAAIQQSSSSVIDSVIEGIVQIDRVGRITRINRAAEQIFGYQENEVLGQNVKLLMPTPYRENHDDYIASYVATGEAKVIGTGRLVTGLRKNGETFPMHLGVTEASTPDGRFFIGLVRDMTVEEKMRSQIEYLARHDALTGLPNRNECWNRLQERFALRSADHRPADCTVFFLDLDGFKPINDTHGHAAGDSVLQEVARRMKDKLFVRDFVARVGGDEFVAVIDGVLDDTRATELGRRMVEAISQPIDVAGMQLQVGTSIGVAHSRQHPDSVEMLINAADSAMYRAKRSGKGQVQIA